MNIKKKEITYKAIKIHLPKAYLMKKHLLHLIIFLLIELSQTSLIAITDSHNYLNREAQKIINRYCKESKIDGFKAVSVCLFLNNSTELATFPKNTSVNIFNRKYIKTQDTIYGSWCIALPEKEKTSNSSINPINDKPNLVFTKIKKPFPLSSKQASKTPSKLRAARSSRRRSDD